jgi:hypothetical protein
VREAYARLDDIGLRTKNPKLENFGYRTLVLPGQKTAHVVDMATRTALCGKAEKNPREPWQDLASVDHDTRMCKTCREERPYAEDDEDGEDI